MSDWLLTDDDDRQREWKVLAYGPSGSGKSTLGVTAPDPVILLSERQGFESVRDAAHRLGKPVPPTFLLTTPDMLRKAFTCLRSKDQPLVKLVKALGGTKKMADALPYDTPQTVVLDSITEFFALVGDEIDEQAPPKTGKDGLPVKAERYWQVLGDRCIGFIRGARDLPYHVLFLALLDDRTVGEGEEASRVYGPAVPMRKLPAQLAAAVNAVGTTYVKQRPGKDDDGKPRVDMMWRVRFSGASYMLTKPKRPLADIEEPDFSAWVEKLNNTKGD